MVALPAGGPSAGGADRARRCGCAACPASWRSRTRCATRVVPSSTAAALMIGLTLVVSMGVFASSLKASFGDVHLGPDQRRPVRRHVQRPGARVQPVGRSRRSRPSPGVDAGLGQRLGPGPVRRRGLELLGGRPGHGRGRHEPRRVRRARSRDLGEDGVVVSKSGRDGPRLEARRHGHRRSSPRPASTGCTWSAIYDGKGWIGDNFVISLAEQNAFAGPQLVATGLVTLADGADQGDGAGRHRGRPGRPPGRQGARPEGVREGGQRVHRPAAHLRHRDAAAGGR